MEALARSGQDAEAVEGFGAAGMAFDRARTELLLGEALTLFERQAAGPWADRSRAELLLAGGRPVRASVRSLGDLTAQELRIAYRVAEGATNREVAGDLFLSPKTVENHLSRIYDKLGVRSRTELSRFVSDPGAGAPILTP